MERVIEHVSEDDGNSLDFKKLFNELFENDIDLEKIYKTIKGTN